MLGQQSVLPLLAIWLGIALLVIAVFVIYVTIKYSPLVSRNFETAAPVPAAAREPARSG